MKIQANGLTTRFAGDMVFAEHIEKRQIYKVHMHFKVKQLHLLLKKLSARSVDESKTISGYKEKLFGKAGGR